MIGYTPAEKFKYWLFQDKIPLTKILILANVITFLAIALFHVEAIYKYMAFWPQYILTQPWGILTYPLIGSSGGALGVLQIVFTLYMIWVTGGSLERSWGFKRYAAFFVTITILSALGILIGSLIVHRFITLSNIYLPLACLIIAQGMTDPDRDILLIIVPMKNKHFALLAAIFTFISFGSINLILGFCALLGCAYAYFYVKRPKLYSEPKQRQAEVVRVFSKRSVWQRLNPFAWIQEWREKRKLKKFFDKSDFRD